MQPKQFISIALLIALGSLPLILQAQLASAYPVKSNGKWGLIDSTGKQVLPLAYESIGKFRKGYAKISQDGRHGLIDSTGKIVISPQYSALINKGNQVLIFSNTAENDSGITLQVWGFINLATGRKVPPSFEYIDFDANCFKCPTPPFLRICNGCHLEKSEMTGGKWGLISLKGKMIQKPIYEEISQSWRPTYYVKMKAGWGIMDTLGIAIVPAKYEEVKRSWNAFSVKKDGLWGLISPTGKTWIEPKYSSLNYAGADLAYFRNEEGFQGLVDTSNQIVVEAKYTSLEILQYGWVSSSNGRLKGLISKDGKELIPPRFQRVIPLSSKIIALEMNGLWGLANQHGEGFIPIEFDEIRLAENGNYMVRLKKHWGIIDSSGNWVIEPSFENLTKFENNISLVRKDGKWGVLHIGGKLILPFEYDKMQRFGTVIRAWKKGDSAPKILYFTSKGDFSPTRKFILVSNGIPGKKSILANRGNLSGWTPQAATRPKLPGWIQAKKTGKWGYQDPKTLRVRIRPKYSDIEFFPSPNLVRLKIRVKRKNLFGFATLKGKVLLKPVFDEIRMEDFQNGGIAACRIGNKYNFVNLKGRLSNIKGITYIADLKNGLYRVNIGGKIVKKSERSPETLYTQNISIGCMGQQKMTYYECEGGKWGLLDTRGKWRLMPRYDYLSEPQKGVFTYKIKEQWGAMTSWHETIIKPEYSALRNLTFADTTFFALSLKQAGSGFINDKGSLVIKPIFSRVKDFSDGLAAASIDKKWGFIDKRGKWAIEAKYSRVSSFSEGIGWVRVRNGWSPIDLNGEKLGQGTFRRHGNYSEGKCAAAQNNLWGYLDQNGEWLIPPKYRGAGKFKAGVAMANQKGRWGLIGKDGKWVVPPKYYQIKYAGMGKYIARAKRGFHLIDSKSGKIIVRNYKDINAFEEGLAALRKDRIYGFIDSNGTQVIPGKYHSAKSFSEDLAAVKIRGKWGFIDKKGRMVIEPLYQETGSFSEGLCAVKINRDWVYINRDGACVIHEKLLEAGPFKNGIAVTRSIKEGWQFIDHNGQIIGKGDYYSIRDFESKLGIFKKDKKFGILNPSGGEVAMPKYDEIGHFSEGFCQVKLSKLMGLKSLDGKQILQPVFDDIREYRGLIRIETGQNVGYLNQKGEWIFEVN